MDSNNNVAWNKSYGGSNNETPGCIAKASDGSIWMAAGTQSTDGQVALSYGNGDAWIAHIDSYGNFLSGKVLGESEGDGATMVQAMNGGMVMAGGTYSGPGPNGGEFPATYWDLSDIFLARIAPWTTSVNPIKFSNQQVNVYPNPATNKAPIFIKSNNECTVTINNVLGQTVYRSITRGESLSIVTSNWTKGIYSVCITDESGHSCVEKLIVE